MNIGILTLPLANNYGGILQAYALQTILKKQGHSVVILKRENVYKRPSLYRKIRIKVLYVLKRILGIKCNKPILSKENRVKVNSQTQYFIDHYLFMTQSLYSTKSIKRECMKLEIDALVVGSDQVWRPEYSPLISNYFFDFDTRKCVKIAYAASFGVDNWEYSDEQTQICSKYAQMFRAISVREKTGVDLCRNNLLVDVQLVLDPTLLLEDKDYIKLVENEKEEVRTGNFFCYILDKSDKKEKIEKIIAKKTGLTPFHTMPSMKATNVNCERNIKACIFPSVTAWLRSFMDAKLVLTDSFHGCVFSIIFNKEFWIVGNKSRGLARFYSLLSLFGLEERLIDESKLEQMDWNKGIDWNFVNTKKSELRNISLDFLKKNLNKKY